jgi:hypothetical protein
MGTWITLTEAKRKSDAEAKGKRGENWSESENKQ